MTKLATLTAELLAAHKSKKTAAAALAKALETDGALRLELATHYFTGRAASRAAPKPPQSRRREGPHRIAGAPTPEQKAGAIAAMRDYTDDVFMWKLRGGKTLGTVRINELRIMAENSAQTASSFLARGYDDAVETFLCVALSNHAVASDPYSLVSDVVKAATVRAILKQSKIKAAELIREGGARVAKELLAAAHKQEAVSAS